MPAWGAVAAAGASLLGSKMQGDAAEEATAAQINAQRDAMLAQYLAAQEARGQAIPLYQSAQTNQLTGIQSGLDVLGQTIPQQIAAAQGGNVMAQQTIRAGMPQSINAILGGNVDLSGIQAQELTEPDYSMFQRQLPQFQTISEVLPTGPNQNMDIMQLLGGRYTPGSQTHLDQYSDYYRPWQNAYIDPIGRAQSRTPFSIQSNIDRSWKKLKKLF